MKRKILIANFFINVVFSMLLPLFSLPSRIAVQFGSDGLPNSWAPKVGFILFLFVIESIVFLLFLFASRIAFKFPGQLNQLPDKEYWLREENKPALKEKITDHMAEMGTAIVIFIMTIMLWTYDANTRIPVHINFKDIIILPGMFVAYSVYWCIKVVRNYRIPENTES